MEWLLYIVAFVFFLAGIGCLILVVAGLPGGWVMLGLAGVIEFADSLYLQAENTQTFDWWILITCGVMLLIGEVIEFLAGLVGAKKGGASRRGMIGSLIGGLLGVFLFAGLFSVIPFVGTIVGAFLGALMGTFLGAYIGEISGEDATLKGAMKPAFGATVGRVIGTVSKVGIAIAIWLTLTVSAAVP